MTDLIFSAILIVTSAMLAASLASFLGVLAERPQRGESLMGRSHCACGRPLKVYENVPILGWLRVRGKTKCCDSKIPARYVVTEFIAAIPGALAGFFLFRMLQTPHSVNDMAPWFVGSIGLTALVLMVSFIVMRNIVGALEQDNGSVGN